MPSHRPLCPRVRLLLTGTFNTASLHLLAFDTLTRTLTITRSILDAQGPHQFLALGTVGQSHLGLQAGFSKTVYATTWASPPSLSSWAVTGLDDGAGQSLDSAKRVSLEWLSTVPITATSSYVHIQPPPFTALTAPSYNLTPGTAKYLYSAGGPTGEIHALDSDTGAILPSEGKLQELIFLAGGSDALERADKSRKALRYGAHSIDVGVNQLAFVADLGRNAILTYRHEPSTGLLTFLSETTSPREGDGPRHVVPSPDGSLVFSVTEHTSFVDVYRLANSTTGQLNHILSLDLLPQGADRSAFRGDTVRLSPSGREIFATTRGKTRDVHGWIGAWDFTALAAVLPDSSSTSGSLSADRFLLKRWQTPTSGGKANAIEWAPRYDISQAPDLSPPSTEGQDSDDWAVLTDDAEGLVLVFHWDGRDLVEVARTQLPGRGDPKLGEGAHEGASHAIWLS